MYIFISIIAFLAIAHVALEVQGVPLGTQLRYLFKPFVWVILLCTLGRVDYRKCRECREREKMLNDLFGKL